MTQMAALVCNSTCDDLKGGKVRIIPVSCRSFALLYSWHPWAALLLLVVVGSGHSRLRSSVRGQAGTFLSIQKTAQAPFFGALKKHGHLSEGVTSAFHPTRCHLELPSSCQGPLSPPPPPGSCAPAPPCSPAPRSGRRLPHCSLKNKVTR